MSFETEELDRKLSNAFGTGVVVDVDLSNPPRAKVQVGELVAGWMRMPAPRTGGNASWNTVEIGEEVAFGASDGDLRNGVILASIYNGTNSAKANSADVQRIDMKDGGFVEYNRASGKLSINATGDVELVAAGEVKITSAKLTHNGKDVGHTHKHVGITPGPANTGVPA